MNVKNEAVIRTLRSEHFICTASFDDSKILIIMIIVNTCASIKSLKDLKFTIQIVLSQNSMSYSII